MSQLLDEPIEPVDVAPAADATPKASVPGPRMTEAVDDFDYHPMPVLVPIALLIALVGLTAFLGLFGILMALAAIPLSAWAIWKVRSSDGFYSGGGLAKTALALALVGSIGGVAYQRHVYLNEVPEGFDRVSFNNDISKHEIATSAFGTSVAPDVRDLEGKTIFLKGYMYPTKQVTDIESFLLLKDTGECCFGGDPEVTDMIGVTFTDDTRANHYEQTLVSIAGTFRINTNYGSKAKGAGPEPLYMLDATYFEPSRTQF